MRALVSASLLIALSASTANGAVLRLQVNHSVRLHLNGQASSVVLGNPSVADATVVDSRTVFLSGRAMGSTDVVVMDALGRTLYQGDVTVVVPLGATVTVFRGGAESQTLACEPTCGSPGSTLAAMFGAAIAGAAAPSHAAPASSGISQGAAASAPTSPAPM